MRLLSPTYPELTLQLPDDQNVRFHSGHADVDDKVGRLAIEHGDHLGVREATDDDVAPAQPDGTVDPSSWPSTFGKLPANPVLPSAASTDVGGPGTAPGETTLVGDRPATAGTAGAAPDAGPVVVDDEIPHPLPEKLTDLSLNQLKLLADRHDVDASQERSKKGVIALLPDREELDAYDPDAASSATLPSGEPTDVGQPGTAPGETEQPQS